VVTRAWLNGLPVNERIIDVLPTPVSPSNRTLYVTSFPLPSSAAPGDDDDDDADFPDDEMRDDIRDETREEDDDVAVEDDEVVDIRDIY